MLLLELAPILNFISSIAVALLAGYFMIKSKREERIAKTEVRTMRGRLEDVYKIAHKAPDGYEWLVINKYSHLDKLHAGYTVIDPVRLEEFISDGLCDKLHRRRPDFGSHVKDVQRFIPAEQVLQYGNGIESLIAGEFAHFDMMKTIRDGKGEAQEFRVKTVKDGAFILAVYDLC
jgi:hypothetical protein